MNIINNKNKIGIIGGTFDPIHKGHEQCALSALKMCFLDKVIFVPTNITNFKQDNDIVSCIHRLEMCRLVLSDLNNPCLLLSEIETKRPGISYTYDTIVDISKKYSDSEICFICGTDSLKTLPYWYNYEKLISMATIIAVTRKNYSSLNTEEQEFVKKYSNKIKILEVDIIDISSSKIRNMIKSGNDVTEFLHKSVYDYIKKHQLYL